jgi:hypothetical protein
LKIPARETRNEKKISLHAGTGPGVRDTFFNAKKYADALWRGAPNNGVDEPMGSGRARPEAGFTSGVRCNPCHEGDSPGYGPSSRGFLASQKTSLPPPTCVESSGW